jgi:thiamine pyrophosphokinase
MKEEPSAIILANGKFPDAKIPLAFLDSAKKIICCDGAVNKLVKYGLEPDAIVGDLDSVSAELKLKYSDRLYEDKIDQDTNDLTKAVRYCVDNDILDVVILGATGIREDHTIANISLLLEYLELLEVRIISDYGTWLPLKSTTAFPSWEGQQISIFSMDSDLEVSSEGLKFPLNKTKLTSWWTATLNESVSDQVKLSFTGGSVCVFLKSR